MKERIIVTLTTWSKRIGNIPYVLDTIYSQTLPPDLVVLNLAFEEVVPENVQEYIDQHCIEINRVLDTKVYKKLIPTLRKYPNDCVISIDDDWLYPQMMIEDFMNIHKRYPNNPISGNREVVCGIQCHCGCASLTKAEYFGDYLNIIDEDVMRNCLSDDMVYSYFSSKAGFPYIRTIGEYFLNMVPYNSTNGYSEICHYSEIQASFNYLQERFGKIQNIIASYIDDKYYAELVNDVSIGITKYMVTQERREVENQIYSSYAFRIGRFLLKPLNWLKYNIFHQGARQE